MTKVTQHLVQLAQEKTQLSGTDYMELADLHCTAHVHEGPDEHYEKGWFKDVSKREQLSIQALYWSEHYCACLVQLNHCTNSRRAIADSSTNS